MEFIFIVNGREDKKDIRQNIQSQIDALQNVPSYSFHPTSGQGDAHDFVRKHCTENPEAEICYVACGGDGTINEVSSGIADAQSASAGISNKHLGVLALGTGNDFVKYYKGSDFKSVKDLFAAKAHNIDILKINDRWSINVCNFGFDSVVGSVGAKMAAKGKKNPYRIGIIAAILTGRFNRIDVWADGEKLGGSRMLLCTLANCHYVGGEFFCAPRAKNDDGLIDVCYLKAISLFRYLGILGIYTEGKHLDSPKCKDIITYRQAKTVKVTAPKTIELCLDGEMLAGTEFNIGIEPGFISILIP